MTTIQVPAGDDLELLASAIDAVCESNAVTFAGSDLPCCSACGGFRLVPPPKMAHRARFVRMAGAEQVARRGYGTCAELAAYDAGAARAQGKAAHCAIIEDARGPGMHHVVMVDEHGRDHDPADPRGCRGGCGSCS
jgi:hypothetical protein